MKTTGPCSRIVASNAARASAPRAVSAAFRTGAHSLQAGRRSRGFPAACEWPPSRPSPHGIRASSADALTARLMVVSAFPEPGVGGPPPWRCLRYVRIGEEGVERRNLVLRRRGVRAAGGGVVGIDERTLPERGADHRVAAAIRPSRMASGAVGVANLSMADMKPCFAEAEFLPISSGLMLWSSENHQRRPRCWRLMTTT